ncbi:MAG: hypothetical protein ACREL7_10570 [Longimicrobiales bacterium]
MRKRFIVRFMGVVLAGALLLTGPATACAQAPERAPVSAFLIETVGGTVGSAAGFGIALALTGPDDCHSDDLACTLRRLGISLLASAGGAATGDVLAGNMADTRPSPLGATIGSLAGIAAGVGIVHLFSEELDITRSDAALFVSYSLSQGILTALGSRLAAWIRD